MKKYVLIGLLVIFHLSTQAQSKKEMNQRMQIIEDKLALKELVDVFSILADKKDVAAQMLLFTDDAKVVSISNGQSSILSGKKQMYEAFTNFLNLFEVVYHINGQQNVSISGNNATGISYCTVTLIGTQDGKKMKTEMGVIYNDEYVKVNGKWLIVNRKSNFTWRNVQPMN